MTDAASPELNPESEGAPPGVSLVQLDDEGRVAVVARSVEEARAVVASLLGESGGDAGGLDLTSTLGGAGTVINAAGSVLQASAGLQGIIRLAPETMRLLAMPGNQLMQSSGQALGTVVNANGQIVANAAFVSVSGASQVAGLATSLGMSVALLAIQLQLRRIEKAIASVTELVGDLASEQREHRWADIETRIERIMREASWAVEIGHVPAGMAEELRGDAQALEAFSRAASRTIGERATRLEQATKAQSQGSVLERDAHVLVHDLVHMIAAADCVYTYEAIRTAAAVQANPGPLADAYAERIIENAATRADALRSTGGRAAESLQRRLRQIEAQPGSAVRPGKRAGVRANAARIADAVAAIAPEPPAIEVAWSSGLDESEAVELAQGLKWVRGVSQVDRIFGAVAPRWTSGPDAVRAAAGVIAARDAFVAISGGTVLAGLVKDFVGTGDLLVNAPALSCTVDEDGEDGALVLRSPGRDFHLRPRAEQLALSASWLRIQLDKAIKEARPQVVRMITSQAEDLAQVFPLRSPR